MPRRSTVVHELRRTIDRLPPATRVAMLEGVRGEQIIVGAYTDGHGGICPMLAAHRRGGRTSLLAFARTWDAFASAPRRGSRPATRRELAVLERHLVASLRDAESSPPAADLREAISAHRSLVARGRADDAARTQADAAAPVPTPAGAPSGPDPAPTPRRRGLPSWMRPLTSVEDYERALAEVDRQHVRLGLVGDTAGPEADAAERTPAR